ncbi:MAG: hypothetical protein PF694_00715 [Bacteroidetes bacterium]|nr:hypothetical protein [Bacteroidota bacterium]
MYQIRLLKQSLVVVLLLLLASACTYDYIEIPQPDPVDPTDTISFQTAIVPIFTDGSNCTACHSTGATAPDLTASNAYSAIVPALVNTADPESSSIYQFAHPSSSTHTWKKLTLGEAALILAWIQQGANNN